MADEPLYRIRMYGRVYLRLTPPHVGLYPAAGWQHSTWTADPEQADVFLSEDVARVSARMRLRGPFEIVAG